MICPNCGRTIEKEEQGCSYCGYKPVIDGEILNEITERIQPEQSVEERKMEGFQPEAENGLSLLLKILIIVLAILIPGIGPIVGIVGGVILMGSPLETNRSFGRLLLGFSIILIGLSIVCCCLNAFLGFGAYLW